MYTHRPHYWSDTANNISARDTITESSVCYDGQSDMSVCLPLRFSDQYLMSQYNAITGCSTSALSVRVSRL